MQFQSIKFSDDIELIKTNYIKNRPYHINLLDELRVNENSHSRIFARILFYNNGKTYPFLKSFFHKIGITEEISDPVISVEKMRIDCLIMDKNYAVIIENKINNAPDQDLQISRYYDSIKAKYNLNEIYVIYLTRQGVKKVTESSLPIDLKETLGKRFIECNFKKDIIDWLEVDALPYCQFKDTLMISAIQQYLDHLKGLFVMRKGEEDMKNEMKEYLKKKLNFGNNADDGVHIAQSIQEANQLLNVLNELQIEFRDGLRKQFLTQLNSDLNKAGNKWECVTGVYKKTSFQEGVHHKFFGFKNTEEKNIYHYMDKSFFLSIEIHWWQKFICGIYIPNNIELQDILIARFAEYQLAFERKDAWIYLQLDEYDFNERKIGWKVYDDEWNSFYVNHSKEITAMFFENINKVYNAWSNICDMNRRDNQ